MPLWLMIFDMLLVDIKTYLCIISCLELEYENSIYFFHKLRCVYRILNLLHIPMRKHRYFSQYIK